MHSQISILDSGLALHGKLVPQPMRALHEKMEKFFNDMKENLSKPVADDGAGSSQAGEGGSDGAGPAGEPEKGADAASGQEGTPGEEPAAQAARVKAPTPKKKAKKKKPVRSSGEEEEVSDKSGAKGKSEEISSSATEDEDTKEEEDGDGDEKKEAEDEEEKGGSRRRRRSVPAPEPAPETAPRRVRAQSTVVAGHARGAKKLAKKSPAREGGEGKRDAGDSVEEGQRSPDDQRTDAAGAAGSTLCAAARWLVLQRATGT